MTHIKVKSRVGPDGLLKLAIPIGMSDANREVRITVEPLEPTEQQPSSTADDWKRSIEEMAGTISDPTFKRHEQGEYEQRGRMFS